MRSNGISTVTGQIFSQVVPLTFISTEPSCLYAWYRATIAERTSILFSTSKQVESPALIEISSSLSALPNCTHSPSFSKYITYAILSSVAPIGFVFSTHTETSTIAVVMLISVKRTLTIWTSASTALCPSHILNQLEFRTTTRDTHIATIINTISNIMAVLLDSLGHDRHFKRFTLSITFTSNINEIIDKKLAAVLMTPF